MDPHADAPADSTAALQEAVARQFDGASVRAATLRFDGAGEYFVEGDALQFRFDGTVPVPNTAAGVEESDFADLWPAKRPAVVVTAMHAHDASPAAVAGACRSIAHACPSSVKVCIIVGTHAPAVPDDVVDAVYNVASTAVIAEVVLQDVALRVARYTLSRVRALASPSLSDLTLRGENIKASDRADSATLAQVRAMRHRADRLLAIGAVNAAFFELQRVEKMAQPPTQMLWAAAYVETLAAIRLAQSAPLFKTAAEFRPIFDDIDDDTNELTSSAKQKLLQLDQLVGSAQTSHGASRPLKQVVLGSPQQRQAHDNNVDVPLSLSLQLFRRQVRTLCAADDGRQISDASLDGMTGDAATAASLASAYEGLLARLWEEVAQLLKEARSLYHQGLSSHMFAVELELETILKLAHLNADRQDPRQLRATLDALRDARPPPEVLRSLAVDTLEDMWRRCGCHRKALLAAVDAQRVAGHVILARFTDAPPAVDTGRCDGASTRIGFDSHRGTIDVRPSGNAKHIDAKLLLRFVITAVKAGGPAAAAAAEVAAVLLARYPRYLITAHHQMLAECIGAHTTPQQLTNIESPRLVVSMAAERLPRDLRPVETVVTQLFLSGGGEPVLLCHGEVVSLVWCSDAIGVLRVTLYNPLRLPVTLTDTAAWWSYNRAGAAAPPVTFGSSVTLKPYTLRTLDLPVRPPSGDTVMRFLGIEALWMGLRMRFAAPAPVCVPVLGLMPRCEAFVTEEFSAGAARTTRTTVFVGQPRTLWLFVENKGSFAVADIEPSVHFASCQSTVCSGCSTRRAPDELSKTLLSWSELKRDDADSAADSSDRSPHSPLTSHSFANNASITSAIGDKLASGDSRCFELLLQPPEVVDRDAPTEFEVRVRYGLPYDDNFTLPEHLKQSTKYSTVRRAVPSRVAPYRFDTVALRGLSVTSRAVRDGRYLDVVVDNRSDGHTIEFGECDDAPLHRASSGFVAGGRTARLVFAVASIPPEKSVLTVPWRVSGGVSTATGSLVVRVDDELAPFRGQRSLDDVQLAVTGGAASAAAKGPPTSPDRTPPAQASGSAHRHRQFASDAWSWSSIDDGGEVIAVPVGPIPALLHVRAAWGRASDVTVTAKFSGTPAVVVGRVATTRSVGGAAAPIVLPLELAVLASGPHVLELTVTDTAQRSVCHRLHLSAEHREL